MVLKEPVCVVVDLQRLIGVQLFSNLRNWNWFSNRIWGIKCNESKTILAHSAKSFKMGLYYTASVSGRFCIRKLNTALSRLFHVLSQRPFVSIIKSKALVIQRFKAAMFFLLIAQAFSISDQDSCSPVSLFVLWYLGGTTEQSRGHTDKTFIAFSYDRPRSNFALQIW